MPESRPDFEPANHDHAVVDVRFAYILARKLTSEDLLRARSNYSQIKKELPAVILPGENESEWLEFSYMRPDATSAWTLRMQDDALNVECSRYTRWEKVWTTAQRFLNFGLAAAVEGDAETTLAGLAMMVTDKFRVLNADYDLRALFRPHDAIPSNLLSRQLIWHSHNGWLEADESRAFLHTLRLECAYDDTGDGEQEATASSMSITLQHSQQVVFRYPVSSSQEGIATIAEAFGHMHLANKRLVTELLTDDMGTRIGLGPTS